MNLRTVTWPTKKLMVYCKNNNIHSLNEFTEYKEKYPSSGLPLDVPDSLNWVDTYRKHNYYSKNECIEKIKDIMEENEELESMDDHEDLLEILNNIDKKIPNNCLWEFYGGTKSDFLIFS